MNLLDCLAPFIALVHAFANDDAMQRRYSAQAFAATLEQCIRDAHARARALGIAADDVAEGLFAVAAWADETLLGLDWCAGVQWPAQLLQRRLFGVNDAGIGFFHRLQGIARGRSAVREVYLACLVLGFRGRHAFDDNPRALDATMHANHLLLEDDGVTARTESPPMARCSAQPSGVAARWAGWWIPMLALLLWAVLVNRLLVLGWWMG